MKKRVTFWCVIYDNRNVKISITLSIFLELFEEFPESVIFSTLGKKLVLLDQSIGYVVDGVL